MRIVLMKYEYLCNQCGQQYSVTQSIHDAPLVQCPNCQSNDFNRIIFAPTVFIKGAKTIGSLADENAKHLPDETLREIEVKQQQIESQTPWFDKSKYRPADATPKKLRSLTPEKKQRYIETGEL